MIDFVREMCFFLFPTLLFGKAHAVVLLYLYDFACCVLCPGFSKSVPHQDSCLLMDAMVALFQVPIALTWLEVIGILWLEASTMDEFVAVGSMCLVRVTLFKKDLLDIMIPFIVGAINPDAFCLIYCWYAHTFLPCDTTIPSLQAGSDYFFSKIIKR